MSIQIELKKIFGFQLGIGLSEKYVGESTYIFAISKLESELVIVVYIEAGPDTFAERIGSYVIHLTDLNTISK